MHVVYLPTWMVDLYGFHVGNYRPYIDRGVGFILHKVGPEGNLYRDQPPGAWWPQFLVVKSKGILKWPDDSG